MPTFQTPSLLTEVFSGSQIPVGTMAYFRAKLRYALHEVVLREFIKQEDSNRINKAELARRIHKKPEQVSRWLGAPGNWTIDTVSDLLLGMGVEAEISAMSLEDRLASQQEKWGDSENIVSPETLQEMPVEIDSSHDDG